MAGLPQAPGPKLGPFRDGNSPLNIDFIKISGKGVHADVWKVSINGKIFALKIFVPYLRPDGFDNFQMKMTREEANMYLKPFSRECRAYGKIKSSGNDDLAVACHGYIMLDERQKVNFRKAGKIADEDWEEIWDYHPDLHDAPLEALVKDYIDFEAVSSEADDRASNLKRIELSFNGTRPTELMKAVRKLHQLGIFHLDLHSDNLVDGRILDFSIACTRPHPELSQMDLDGTYEATLSNRDEWDLDKLIDEWNEYHPRKRIYHRMKRNRDYCKRLRSSKCLLYPEFEEKNGIEQIESGSEVDLEEVAWLLEAKYGGTTKEAEIPKSGCPPAGNVVESSDSDEVDLEAEARLLLEKYGRGAKRQRHGD